jgi:hypothetical protein
MTGVERWKGMDHTLPPLVEFSMKAGKKSSILTWAASAAISSSSGITMSCPMMSLRFWDSMTATSGGVPPWMAASVFA